MNMIVGFRHSTGLDIADFPWQSFCEDLLDPLEIFDKSVWVRQQEFGEETDEARSSLSCQQE